jgi:hypothetical protein
MKNIIHLDKYPKDKLAEKRENMRKHNPSAYQKNSKTIKLEDHFSQKEISHTGNFFCEVKKGLAKALKSYSIREVPDTVFIGGGKYHYKNGVTTRATFLKGIMKYFKK